MLTYCWNVVKLVLLNYIEVRWNQAEKKRKIKLKYNCNRLDFQNIYLRKNLKYIEIIADFDNWNILDLSESFNIVQEKYFTFIRHSTIFCIWYSTIIVFDQIYFPSKFKLFNDMYFWRISTISMILNTSKIVEKREISKIFQTQNMIFN